MKLEDRLRTALKQCQPEKSEEEIEQLLQTALRHDLWRTYRGLIKEVVSFYLETIGLALYVPFYSPIYDFITVDWQGALNRLLAEKLIVDIDGEYIWFVDLF